MLRFLVGLALVRTSWRGRQAAKRGSGPGQAAARTRAEPCAVKASRCCAGRLGGGSGAPAGGGGGRIIYNCRRKQDPALLVGYHPTVEKVIKISKGGDPQYGMFKKRKFEISKLYPNIIKAKSLLKWEPTNEMNKNLNKVINWYKEYA